MSKQKILTGFQIIALVVAIVGAVTLFYNAIDMLINTPFVDDFTSTVFKDGQKPFAIITLVASLIAFAGVGAGISSLFVKSKYSKTVCIAISACTIVVCLALIIAASCVWSNFYNKNVYEGYTSLIPHPIRGETMSSMFAIYSSVMSMLIQQFVYTVIFTVALIANYLIDLKSAKAQKKDTAEITAQTEKENN